MEFEAAFSQFMQEQMDNEPNDRRMERLTKGLGHAETEFLRSVWYPAIGNFNDLYPEWEVRDFANKYRYLDFAYMPGKAKSAIEIQGFGSHARDIDSWRFKDLCLRHTHLALDDWIVLPFAYPSITESPKQCQQLVLSLVGKMISYPETPELNWLENETLRFARRIFRPFTPANLATHLQISRSYARTILHKLVDKNLLKIVNCNERARNYQIV